MVSHSIHIGKSPNFKTRFDQLSSSSSHAKLRICIKSLTHRSCARRRHFLSDFGSRTQREVSFQHLSTQPWNVETMITTRWSPPVVVVSLETHEHYSYITHKPLFTMVVHPAWEYKPACLLKRPKRYPAKIPSSCWKNTTTRSYNVGPPNLMFVGFENP
jgi:hypothetical protein